MISNPKLIGVVKKGIASDEFFFTYKDKYKWSIRKVNETFILYFYPGDYDIRNLLAVDEWENVDMISYNPEQIGTREAMSSFEDLYGLMAERATGMNEILDDIISDVEL